MRSSPPFKKLPHGDAVEFHVTKYSGLEGLYSRWTNGAAAISISCKNVKRPGDVLMVTAHEMLHLLQDLNGTDSRCEHNADFKKMALRICSLYGWSTEDFL